jgi:mRNA interferase YafQ
MNETLYEVKKTARFKKDCKMAIKRGEDIGLLREIITQLADGQALQGKHRDHALTGSHSDFSF